MSYILMNQDVAKLTNLIPDERKCINDLYSSLKVDLCVYVRDQLAGSRILNVLEPVLDSIITRKLVKSLFMPMVYGKTVRSMGEDLEGVLKSLLSRKECSTVATVCYQFWCHKYPDIANTLNLLNCVGWLCSTLDKPVQFSVPFFTTTQDYMRFEDSFVWIHVKKKGQRKATRHKITLSLPTEKRDKLKSI